MSRNVLLVALDPVPEDEVRKAIAERNEGADVNVHVVAPATHMGTCKWLTGEEVDAEVETEVGERDPLLAVEDALALFPADEILVAGTADEKTEAGLRRFGLPVSRLGSGGEVGGEEATGAEAVARGVAQGKREETPFLVVGTVGAILLGLVE